VIGSTFVIAEAGVNHNGDLDLALQLVDAAAEAGADCVKFQTFRADKLASRHAQKAAYQQETTGAGESQLAMLRRLELSPDAHRRLIERCGARNIAFLSSPFDLESLACLADDLGLDRLKLGSGELTNGPLLLEAARTGLPLILSTGMATLDEVQEALGVLAWGWTVDDGEPSRDGFAAAWESRAGKAAVAERVVLLQCTTEYPAPFADVNLRAMVTLAQTFGVTVGFSDHTPGINMPIAAVARGAQVIEKHFTLDRSLPGPDHRASLEPDELAAMVRGIRQVEAALGDGVKAPAPSELGNRGIARKGIVAARPIAAGSTFGAADLACKRPESGLSPMQLWDLLGRPVSRDYATDEAIDAEELEP
jgi:N-acetylneuraminate synthase